MPREVIKSHPNTDFATEIGWEKGRTAQLGVTTTAKVKVAELKNVGSSGIGLWCSLTPESIDELIKVLRKAKRQLLLDPDPL